MWVRFERLSPIVVRKPEWLRYFELDLRSAAGGVLSFHTNVDVCRLISRAVSGGVLPADSPSAPFHALCRLVSVEDEGSLRENGARRSPRRDPAADARYYPPARLGVVEYDLQGVRQNALRSCAESCIREQGSALEGEGDAHQTGSTR